MNRPYERPLWRRLLSVGREAGRRAEAASTRFTALAIAAFVVSLCLGTLVAVHSAYVGKESRREARTPVWQVQQPSAKNATLWLVGSDALGGKRRFSVVYIQPHTADAPLPPGIDRWPRPGEAVLSPGLLKAGAGEAISSRYGKLAGTIGKEGLEDPGEWLAYVRPSQAMAPERPVEPVVGFGPEAGKLSYGLEPGSARFDDKPEWMFQALVSGVLFVPSLVLLFVAVRAGAHGRDRRGSLIDAIGGRRRDRILIAAGEMLRPTSLGAAASIPFIAASMVVDVQVPYTNYLMSSADLREHGWMALLAPVVSVVVALIVAVATDQISGRARGNRLHSSNRGHWQRRIAFICPVAILLAVRGPDLAGENTGYRVWITWVGLVAVVLTLPTAVSVMVSAFGRSLERTSRKRGWPSALVASRRIHSYPESTIRLVTGVVVALIVFAQISAWTALFGSHYTELESALRETDKNVVAIGPKGTVSAQDTADFLHRLPANSLPLLLTSPGRSDGPVTLRGSCRALQSLRLPCSNAPKRVGQVLDRRVQQLLRWNTGGGTRLEVVRSGNADFVKQATQNSEDGTLAVISTKGGPPPVPALKKLSYEIYPRGAQVRYPGEDWATAAIPDRDQGRWASLLGVIGIGILVMAVCFGGNSEFLRHARALAPITVLTDGYGVLRSSAAWVVLGPLVVAGLAGGIVSTWLARPVSRTGSTYYMPIELTAAAVATVFAMSVVMWWWASRVAVKHARSWQVNDA